MSYFDWTIRLGKHRFGFSHDLVLENSDPYLERWIFWCGISLRLHKFHKGDDDRAFHDHPWWFITIPLRKYRELTPKNPPKEIKAYRLYFRGSGHRHIVRLISTKPVWTLILAGRKTRDWGFWNENHFTRANDWLDQVPEHKPDQV